MRWWLVREWRGATRRGLAAFWAPAAAAAALAWVLPPHAAGATALLPLAAAVVGTARRVWREQRTGLLAHLALAPVPTRRLLAQRVVARAAILWLQWAPWALAATARGLSPAGAPAGGHGPLAGAGPWPGWALAAGGPLGPWAAPLAAALHAGAGLALGALAGAAAGAAIGLSVRRWGAVHAAGALACLLGWGILAAAMGLGRPGAP